MGDEIDAAMRFRNRIIELEKLAREIIELNTTGREKEKLLKLHEQLKSDLKGTIEFSYSGVRKIEKHLKGLPLSIENAGRFEKIKKSLDRASELLEQEKFKECMSEILVYLDRLREFETSLRNSSK